MAQKTSNYQNTKYSIDFGTAFSPSPGNKRRRNYFLYQSGLMYCFGLIIDQRILDHFFLKTYLGVNFDLKEYLENLETWWL